MNIDLLLPPSDIRSVSAGLVGVGEFGQSLIGQSLLMPELSVRALADRDADKATAVLSRIGIDADQVVVTDSLSRAKTALETGSYVILPDGEMLADLPLDVIVEATGSPEGAAANALAAIGAGKHVAMVSKETDAVIGPELAARAKEAGVVVTPIDGDQPSLLMGLVSYARRLGFPIVAGGKSSEYDFVWDQANRTVSWRDKIIAEPEQLSDLWDMGTRSASEILAARNDALSDLPQQKAPDINEMLLVANHTGLMADTSAFHRPIARTVEVPSFLCPVEDGGLLGGTGRIDVFNCWRRSDEISFAGGVFVVVDTFDRDTWDILADKGHVVSRCGRYGMISYPQHFLGIEATISVLIAAISGNSSGSPDVRPVADMVARAERDMKAGEVLAMNRRHEIPDVAAEMIPAAPVTAGQPLPYFLAAGNTLVTNVAAGTLLTPEMIVEPEGSLLWKTRREQDGRFFGTE